MQKLLEVAQFKAIRGNLILVIIASYTLILELVNRSQKNSIIVVMLKSSHGHDKMLHIICNCNPINTT